MRVLEIGIMLACEMMASLVPIRVANQRVAQDAGISQRCWHALSERGIAGCSSITKQCDSVAVWMIHPRLANIEGCERAHAFNLGIGFGQSWGCAL